MPNQLAQEASTEAYAVVSFHDLDRHSKIMGVFGDRATAERALAHLSSLDSAVELRLTSVSHFAEPQTSFPLLWRVSVTRVHSLRYSSPSTYRIYQEIVAAFSLRELQNEVVEDLSETTPLTSATLYGANLSSLLLKAHKLKLKWSLHEAYRFQRAASRDHLIISSFSQIDGEDDDSL